MADITYCKNSICPFKNCVRHPSKIKNAALYGKGYVSVASYDGVCQRYTVHLAEQALKGGVQG